MKNILFILILQLFLVSTIKAQTEITGQVIDQESGNNIAFVYVSLFKKADKEHVKSTYTDENGKFQLLLPNDAELFYIEAQTIGYYIQKIVLNENNSKTPFTIKIQSDESTALSTIKLSEKTKAVSLSGDKIIYNIEEIGIANGNNGIETLKLLPGINTDINDNIQFRGSAGIQIMINNKKTMLEGKGLHDFLLSLRAEDIKSIEIIAQPSARYEATGTTGILNIVLKKNVLETLGGGIYTYSKYGKYYGNQTGGRFFYNDDKWSINANGSYYDGKSFNDRDVVQEIKLDNSDQRLLTQHNYWLPKTASENFNIGIERKINNNQLISTEWQIHHSNQNDETDGITKEYLNGDLQEEVLLTQTNKKTTNQISGNVFYNYSSDSLDTRLDIQINYSRLENTLTGSQIDEYLNKSFNQLDGENETEYNLMNLQVDWVQKLSDKVKLETGTKFSYIDMEYFNHYKKVEGNDFIIPDSLLINDFQYKENINSAYSQLKYDSEHWSLLVGLRMENYNYKAISKNNNKNNKDSRTNWFPSASVSYKQDKNQYRLSYSRRISRPSYLNLNPYYLYLDAYSVEKGNPELKPQMYHSFELNYIFKQAFSFSLYGYLYNDGVVKVIDYQTNENYNIVYDSNASSGSRFGISTSIPYEVGNWLTMQFNGDIYLNREKSKIPNYAYDGKGYGYELSMINNVTLFNKWELNLTTFFLGRSTTPTGFSPSIFDLNITAKKSFLQDKLELSTGVSSILNNSKYDLTSNINNINTHWINKWEARKAFVQLTYRFGGSKDKNIKNTSLQEETNRL